MLLQYRISYGPDSVWVSARSKAAARSKGRRALRVPPEEEVTLRRSLDLGVRIGGMKLDEQIGMLTEYSEQLASKTPKELAYQRLGKKAPAMNPGESVASAFQRAGVDPVACAIVSGGEAAGTPGAGAARAADWLSEKLKQSSDVIRPAFMQSFTAGILLLAIFAMPILCDKMFNILPGDIVQIQDSAMSEFLRAVYAAIYEPFGEITVMVIVTAAFSALCYALTLTRGAVRERIPMLGPLTLMAEQERVTAWINMYMPFHAADLPYVEFVRAGRRAFKTGGLAESFRLLDRDVRAGEADTLATAAALHPEAVPIGLAPGLRIMADMNVPAGQRHLANLLETSERKMRNYAGRALRQAKMARMIVIAGMVFTILTGIYLPMIESSSMPSF